MSKVYIIEEKETPISYQVFLNNKKQTNSRPGELLEKLVNSGAEIVTHSLTSVFEPDPNYGGISTISVWTVIVPPTKS